MLLDEHHASRGAGRVHRGWRCILNLSKGEAVWSHFRKGNVKDQQGTDEGGPHGRWMSAQGWFVLGLSPAMLGYLETEVGKADGVLVVRILHTDQHSGNWDEMKQTSRPSVIIPHAASGDESRPSK